MDKDETHALIRDTVKETLLSMGVDISRPEAVQAMQADFAFIRRQRETGEKLRAHAAKALLGLVATGVVGLASWLAASLTWKGHP
jgi:hypothetical protein